MIVLQENTIVESVDNADNDNDTVENNCDNDNSIEEGEKEEEVAQLGGGRAGTSFDADQRKLLKNIFAKNGPPKSITNNMVKMAQQKFPAFIPLWDALLLQRGSNRKAKNTIFKAIGGGKKKVTK